MSAESWPLVDGSITDGNVTVIHGWIIDYALGHLNYCYRVRGEYYAGRIVRQFSDEQVAWNFVDAHRGKPALVRYRDDSAEKSILRDADQQSLWIEDAGPGFYPQLRQHWRDAWNNERDNNVVHTVMSDEKIAPDDEGDFGDSA